MSDSTAAEIILPTDILGEIASHLQDYLLAREVSRVFSERIPPTAEYRCYLGLITDDPKLVADAVSRKSELKKDICATAAAKGSLEVLKWARENGCSWNSWTCAYAARNGHLEVIKWARENGCEWNSWTCAGAALNGHLYILEWAHQNGCPWSSSTCECAARNGHLEVIKWARENGCSWNSWTCAYAAQNGHLEVLKWARANGCELDSWICMRAAENGHLEVLKWARENGCKWSSRTWVFAALNCHFNILDWIEGRLEIKEQVSFIDSVLAGKAKLIEWFKANKYAEYQVENTVIHKEIQTPEGHQRILALFREHGLID